MCAKRATRKHSFPVGRTGILIAVLSCCAMGTAHAQDFYFSSTASPLKLRPQRPVAAEPAPGAPPATDWVQIRQDNLAERDEFLKKRMESMAAKVPTKVAPHPGQTINPAVSRTNQQ